MLDTDAAANIASGLIDYLVNRDVNETQLLDLDDYLEEITASLLIRGVLFVSSHPDGMGRLCAKT